MRAGAHPQRGHMLLDMKSHTKEKDPSFRGPLEMSLKLRAVQPRTYLSPAANSEFNRVGEDINIAQETHRDSSSSNLITKMEG